MAVETAGGAKLIEKFKPQLVEALSGDPDFLLQYCQASGILTQREYDRVKASTVPFNKARDILDYVMKKDRKRVQTFLSLLQKKEIQETFPELGFLNEMPLSNFTTQEENKKRKESKEKPPEEDVPRKHPRKAESRMVTEKQLMRVASYIGSNWKEVGRIALEISNVRLDQIISENPNNHREWVFNMLYQWSLREKHRATAAHLYSLLTEEDFGVKPGDIKFLLEES